MYVQFKHKLIAVISAIMVLPFLVVPIENKCYVANLLFTTAKATVLDDVEYYLGCVVGECGVYMTNVVDGNLNRKMTEYLGKLYHASKDNNGAFANWVTNCVDTEHVSMSPFMKGYSRFMLNLFDLDPDEFSKEDAETLQNNLNNDYYAYTVNSSNISSSLMYYCNIPIMPLYFSSGSSAFTCKNNNLTSSSRYTYTTLRGLLPSYYGDRICVYNGKTYKFSQHAWSLDDYIVYDGEFYVDGDLIGSKYMQDNYSSPILSYGWCWMTKKFAPPTDVYPFGFVELTPVCILTCGYSSNYSLEMNGYSFVYPFSSWEEYIKLYYARFGHMPVISSDDYQAPISVDYDKLYKAINDNTVSINNLYNDYNTKTTHILGSLEDLKNLIANLSPTTNITYNTDNSDNSTNYDYSTIEGSKDDNSTSVIYDIDGAEVGTLNINIDDLMELFKYSNGQNSLSVDIDDSFNYSDSHDTTVVNPTATPAPTATPIPTPTPTPTPTPIPTSTPTATPEPTATNKPDATVEPTEQPTERPTHKPTKEPTPEPTATGPPVNGVTDWLEKIYGKVADIYNVMSTPTVSPIVSDAPKATATPTSTPIPTSLPIPTEEPKASDTPVVSPTATASNALMDVLNGISEKFDTANGYLKGILDSTPAPFPTQMPYPTQIPYPTQLPYPTQIPYLTYPPYPTSDNADQVTEVPIITDTPEEPEPTATSPPVITETDIDNMTGLLQKISDNFDKLNDETLKVISDNVTTISETLDSVNKGITDFHTDFTSALENIQKALNENVDGSSKVISDISDKLDNTNKYLKRLVNLQLLDDLVGLTNLTLNLFEASQDTKDKLTTLQTDFSTRAGFVAQIIELNKYMLLCSYGEEKPNFSITIPHNAFNLFDNGAETTSIYPDSDTFGSDVSTINADCNSTTVEIVNFDYFDRYRDYIHAIMIAVMYYCFIRRAMKRLPTYFGSSQAQ